jgi:hypothetical protein
MARKQSNSLGTSLAQKPTPIPVVGGRGVIGVVPVGAPPPKVAPMRPTRPSFLQQLEDWQAMQDAGQPVADPLQQALQQPMQPMPQPGALPPPVAQPMQAVEEEPFPNGTPGVVRPPQEIVDPALQVAQEAQNSRSFRLPTAPVFEDPARAPILSPITGAPSRDILTDQQAQQDAIRTALLAGGLSQLFGGGSFAARATPGLAATAAEGAVAGQDRAAAIARQNWLDSMTQTGANNSLAIQGANAENDVIQGRNRNKQTTFDNELGIARVEGKADAELTKAQTAAKTSYIKYFQGLDDAAQEQEALASPEAAKYGFSARYDANGKFIPYRNFNDATKRLVPELGLEGKKVTTAGRVKGAEITTAGRVKGAEIRAGATMGAANVAAKSRVDVAKILGESRSKVAAMSQAGAMARVVLTQEQVNNRAKLTREQKAKQFEMMYGTKADSVTGQRIISAGARLSKIEHDTNMLAQALVKQNSIQWQPGEEKIRDKNIKILTDRIKALDDEHARVFQDIQRLQQKSMENPTGPKTVTARSGRSFEVTP